MGGVAFPTNESRLQVQEFEPLFSRLGTIIINIENIFLGTIGFHSSTDCSPNFLERSLL